jgi:hypothetical protein
MQEVKEVLDGAAVENPLTYVTDREWVVEDPIVRAGVRCETVHRGRVG